MPRRDRDDQDRAAVRLPLLSFAGRTACRLGISGFVLIAESHLSIHTFPARGLVWADIFSCKGFDAERVVERVKSTFGLGDTRLHLLERGLEYAEQVAPLATAPSA